MPLLLPGRITTMTMTAITIAPTALPTTISTRLRWRRRAARSRSCRMRSAGRGPAGPAHYVPGDPLRCSIRLHAGHSPNSSTVWSTAVNPASAATCSAQRSTARPSTSTLVPQLRQMR